MARLDRLLKKARTATAKGKLAKALDFYREACAHAPSEVAVWSERAKVAVDADDMGDAVTSLFQLADLHARAGLVEEAAGFAEQVLEIDPSHGGAKRLARLARRSRPAREDAPQSGAETMAALELEADAPAEANAPARDAAAADDPLEPRAAAASEAAVAKEAAAAKEDDKSDKSDKNDKNDKNDKGEAPVQTDPDAVVTGEQRERAPVDEMVTPPVSTTSTVDGGAELDGWLKERAERARRVSDEFPIGPVTGQIALAELSAQAKDSEQSPVEFPLELSSGDHDVQTVKAVAAAVGSSPLLSELDSDLMRYLVDGGRMAQFPAGNAVFMEGERGKSLFLVLEGSVQVEKDDSNASRPRRLATLRRGAFFGEMALLSDNPRSATVRAKTAATLLEVSRESMRELIVREPRVLTLLMRFFRARLVGTLMATSPIFSRLDATERRELITQFRLRELPAAHEVLSQGQSGDGLYLVLAGELVVYRTPETAGGDKRVLGVLSSGDVFGEMSLLAGTAATAHVRAVDRAWVLRLPVEQFKSLAEAHPEVRAHLDEIAESRRAENRTPVALASVTPI